MRSQSQPTKRGFDQSGNDCSTKTGGFPLHVVWWYTRRMDIFALPKNFIKDKQKKYPDKSAVEGLKSGEGVVIEDEGRKIAVFKNLIFKVNNGSEIKIKTKFMH